MHDFGTRLDNVSTVCVPNGHIKSLMNSLLGINIIRNTRRILACEGDQNEVTAHIGFAKSNLGLLLNNTKHYKLMKYRYIPK